MRFGGRAISAELPPEADYKEILSDSDQSRIQRDEALQRLQRMADDRVFDFDRLRELDN